jgi:Leucine-rich repeat (LRR) protein
MTYTTTTTMEEYIKELPLDVEIICLSGRELRALPDLRKFTQLKKLSCSNNYLTSISELNPTLEVLECDRNFISELPYRLPRKLRVLQCEVNKLTELPSLKDTLLETLICGVNGICSLPELPPMLMNLDCPSNLLKLLPSLPDKLERLDCSDNQLNYIPPLNMSLKYLDCSRNPGIIAVSFDSGNLQIVFK